MSLILKTSYVPHGPTVPVRFMALLSLALLSLFTLTSYVPHGPTVPGPTVPGPTVPIHPN